MSQGNATKLLISALKRVKAKSNNGFVKSSEISRRDREKLSMAGFLEEFSRGWFSLVNPESFAGGAELLRPRIYDFLKVYLHDRFGEGGWCFQVDNSIAVHIGNFSIPESIVCIVSRNINQTTNILGIPLTIYRAETNPVNENGFQVMAKVDCLCKMPVEKQKDSTENLYLELISVSTAEELTEAAKILKTSQTTRYKALIDRIKEAGKEDVHTWIIKSLGKGIMPDSMSEQNIYKDRVRGWWKKASKIIIDLNPKFPSGPKNPEAYIKLVEDVYVYDTYNSLTMEGFKVSEELIEKIANGEWNPEKSVEDMKRKDALAIRGYGQALRFLESRMVEIISTKDFGKLFASLPSQIFFEMHRPHIVAGIGNEANYVGYRNHPVYLKNYEFVPPSFEALPDMMEEYCNLIAEEKNPLVRAILSHYIFVTIHPFHDGNGRTGRLLMNVSLAASGLHWITVPNELRNKYMASLSKSQSGKSITDFVKVLENSSKLTIEKLSENK